MDQQVNLFSKLKTYVVGVIKVKLLHLKLFKLNPKPCDLIKNRLRLITRAVLVHVAKFWDNF